MNVHDLLNPLPLRALPRPLQYGVPRDWTNKPYGSLVLHTLLNREVRQIEPLRVPTSQATLERKLPLGELLQYGPPKPPTPRDVAGHYCPKDHIKHDKKPHEADFGQTDLLSGCLPGHLPPQRSELLPDHLGTGGVGTSPPAGAGTALADPELTDNTTTAHKSSTPTALGGGNQISKLAPPTGLEYQEFPTNTDSDITLEGSSGANADDSTYLGL